MHDFFLVACRVEVGALLQISLCTLMRHGQAIKTDAIRLVRYRQHIFTFIQFPDWYRNRAHGWLIYGYLEVDIQDRVVGGLSAVVRQVLLHFFSPTSFNIGVGIELPVGSAQASLVHLRARLACLIQDGKAHQLVHSYKGASGWKCCPHCKTF